MVEFVDGVVVVVAVVVFVAFVVVVVVVETVMLSILVVVAVGCVDLVVVLLVLFDFVVFVSFVVVLVDVVVFDVVEVNVDGKDVVAEIVDVVETELVPLARFACKLFLFGNLILCCGWELYVSSTIQSHACKQTNFSQKSTVTYVVTNT